MTTRRTSLMTFNKGIVSPLGAARSDVKRLALAAETMTNWLPRVLGSMSIRPGLKYIGATASNAAARLIPFRFSVDETATIELTNALMRIWESDALVTRPSVSSSVANSSFTGKYSNTVTFTGGGSANAVYTGTDDFVVDNAISFSTTGTLPASLTAGTTYYVKSVNTGTNTITLAATRPTASASAITMATAGTGTHTIYAHAVITSWTDSDESSCYSEWVTGDYLGLTGNGTNAAIVDQTVTVAGGDQNIVHALAIHVVRGPVTLRVGTSSSDDSYIREVDLRTGYHNLAFTPTGNFNIRLQSRLEREVLVDSCAISASGTVTLVSPYSSANLDYIRYDQTGDIIFMACADKKQMMVERRSNSSWSLVEYDANDGPFLSINITPITMTASKLNGNGTLTASAPYFRSTNVGGLFKLSSKGQTVTANIAAAADTWTDPIRVTGITTSRTFTYTISGRTATTIRLQRSLESSTGPWTTVASYTANTTANYTDGLNNQVAWYRIGINAADYGGADVIDVTLDYTYGSIDGVCRVTGFTSSTVVSMEVLDDFGKTTSTLDWYEGSWSDRRGWPTSVGFHEGRLWYAGKGEIWGSVSDAYTSFTDSIEGATGMINRLIATGGTDTINWILSGQRLLVGAEGVEFSARSSTLDEPLSPTAFTLRGVSTQGSGSVQAAKIDSMAFFVGRTGTRIFAMDYSSDSLDYKTDDITKLTPEIGLPYIKRIAVQRQPDTRIHAVRSDGIVLIGVFDHIESILCWSLLETDGTVEDVVVFPADLGDQDDKVYYLVNRTINGSTVRYIEKMAQQDDCIGGSLSYLADSYVTYTGAAATSIPVAHLEGESVCVWANGYDVGTNSSLAQTYTVSSGVINLATAATNVVVGLPYSASWKSMKVGPQVEGDASLGKVKKIDHVALILANTHTQGLRYGPDFTNLDNKPGWEDGDAVATGQIDSAYDTGDIEFPGTWTPDLRICLKAQAPRPCTVLGVSLTYITE